jgi:inhibitor of cysteine peptidase
MITIDKTHHGKKIVTKKGDVIKVQLAENQTTGYLWQINLIDDKHLKSKENEYEISGEAIGAGGIRTFYLEVIKEGISELHFALAKPWENEPVETFNVTIES